MKFPLLNNIEQNAAAIAAFDTNKKVTWCGNCGNYGIQAALKRALALEGLTHRDVLLCYDVGCSGNGSDKVEAMTIHGLHGRVLPLAAGAALANSKIKVIASAGDGATFSEGVNHLVHAVRSNYRMIFLHHDNENYGLTTGQPSALTCQGAKMNAAPDGVTLPPLNPIDFVLGLHPTFVARAYSGEIDHLTELLRRALKHPGFAFIDILQACPTYNKATPDHWYAARVKDISHFPDHDPCDLWAARKLVAQTDQVAIGVLYENDRPDFYSLAPGRSERKTALTEEVGYQAINTLY